MTNIGIIAGGGNLPLLIGKSLLQKKYNIIFFCINNFADEKKYNKFSNFKININSFSNIIKILKEKKIDKIIMAGNISRPSVKDIKFDIKSISLIKDYLLESKGDDSLLKLISNFFLKNGFPLFDWKNVCNDLFANEDLLTSKKPSKMALNNKSKGLEIFKIIGRADIGQSLIVQNQLILGFECLEGTDELIIRCEKYKKVGDKGVLIKLSKYNQHSELDVPTIGLETIKNLHLYNYEGLFIEKNKCIIIEKDKIIDYCNINNIFLSTVNKIE